MDARVKLVLLEALCALVKHLNAKIVFFCRNRSIEVVR